ncbi:carboxypeptidase-like regulatory domain-containing protein, partial [bacterium]|nr:carboxypeptidase-like regulatory domain-containing protein [bacterium]
MRYILLITLYIMSSLPLSAQSTGSIQGTVLDETTQQPIIGANVIIPETNRGAATDLDGKFIVERLPVGTYL